MTCSSISLKSLIDVAKNDAVGDAMQLDSVPGKALTRIMEALCTAFPEEQGVYLWGSVSNKVWGNVYLGKAGSGKTTSLRARVLKELSVERAFLWHGPDMMTHEQALAAWQRYYPSEKRGATSHIKRSLRKCKSTHIVAMPLPGLNEADLSTIEAILIGRFKPIANIQNTANRKVVATEMILAQVKLIDAALQEAAARLANP